MARCQDATIKTFALIEDKNIFSDIVQQINIDHQDTDLTTVNKAILIGALRNLKRVYNINWQEHKFKVIFEDIRKLDNPTINTEFLKEVFIEDMWCDEKRTYAEFVKTCEFLGIGGPIN